MLKCLKLLKTIFFPKIRAADINSVQVLLEFFREYCESKWTAKQKQNCLKVLGIKKVA